MKTKRSAICVRLFERKIFSLFTLVSFLFLFSCQKEMMKIPANNRLIIESNFEDNNDLKKWSIEISSSTLLKLSDSFARQGRYSFRFNLKKTDPIIRNGKRSELCTSSPKNSDGWYGFSNYLPEGYLPDNGFEIVAQWHEVPDFELGESWRIPPISLSTNNGHWYLNIKWATAKVNTNNTIDGKKIFDLGSYARNIWNDWVFHINFSWKEDGVIQVWKNGQLIVEYHGSNCYNDKNYPYFKFGIYKPGWNKGFDQKNLSTISERTIYYDAIKVGNEEASYEDVSP